MNKTAREDLIEIIKEDFKGNNEVRFIISERGNQRIEIEDKDNGEIWHTLEAVGPIKDMNDYEDISIALMQALYKLTDE